MSTWIDMESCGWSPSLKQFPTQLQCVFHCSYVIGEKVLSLFQLTGNRDDMYVNWRRRSWPVLHFAVYQMLSSKPPEFHICCRGRTESRLARWAMRKKRRNCVTGDEERGEKKKRTGRAVANLCAASEFVRQLLYRSPLTSSSSSTLPVPPMSVNPLVKKQMFHHRGTSTRGCLTRRMECLLLLLGRQQTAGWESGQKERQESQSECQLAGLRLQQRRLPAHWKTHTGTRTHPGMHAHQHASTRRSIHTSKHAQIFTLFMLRIRKTTTRTHALEHTLVLMHRPSPLAACLSTAQACDTEAEGICCGLLLDWGGQLWQGAARPLWGFNQQQPLPPKSPGSRPSAGNTHTHIYTYTLNTCTISSD